MSQKTFTLREANALIPRLMRLTGKADQRLADLRKRIADEQDGSVRQGLMHQANQVAQEWGAEVSELGGVPNGIWLVDFDNGRQFYCWKYGEDAIRYIHGYREGFAGRKALN